MAYIQRLPVRFDDVDYAQIVYFPRLFGYCHWVFEDFFGKEVGVPYAKLLRQKRIGFPVVHSEADFRAPFQFGDVCRVEMEMLRMGISSVTHRYNLYRGEGKVLGAQIVLVTAATHLDKLLSVKIPPRVRAAFQKHAIP